MGSPQENGKSSAKEVSLKCPAGHREGSRGSLFTWKSGICFKACCSLSKDTSLGYHHPVVRNQEVTNLTYSFQRSAITTRLEFKLYHSTLSLSSEISFCTKQIWENKRASNREAHSPNPNEGIDSQGLGKFPGFGIIWDSFITKCTESKMHIQSEE